jgi:serine/threonine protein kinase
VIFQKSSDKALTNKLQDGPWRLEWKNDGFDYLKLLKEFQAGQAQFTRLSNKTTVREVYRVHYMGRDFVLKHDTELEKLPEKRLWIRLAGTLFSRLIKMTTKAAQKGCTVAQEIFLVAERLSGPFCQESYLIAEYIPGQCFMKEVIEKEDLMFFIYRRPDPFIHLIINSLNQLHKYGLASDDIELSNMILTSDNQIKFIDLHPRGPIFLCQASDILKMKTFYNINTKSANVFVNLLAKIRYWHHLFRHQMRVWRNRLPAPDVRVIWEDESEKIERLR